MDVVLKTEDGRFNFRACAVIINGNKLLAMRDENAPYYYLVGGKVNLHERAEDAVLREIKEEMNIDAEIIRPLWLCQNFFTEEVTKDRFHEICFYYLADISKTDILKLGDKFILREGKHTLTFEWLDMTKLYDKNIKPGFIKKEVLNLPETLKLITVSE